MKKKLDKNRLLRLCVIGAGSIFQNFHFPAIEETGLFELVGIVDSNKSVAEKVSRQLKVPVFKSVADITNVDVCFIATPPHIRSQIIIPILEKGMHVVCEKPFTYTSDEGRKIIEVADENNKSVFVTQTRRFFTNIAIIRDLIKGNVIRDLSEITIVEGGLYGWSSVGNDRAEIIPDDSGVLHDTGSHLVDMLLFMLDKYELNINDIKVKKSLMDLPLASNNFKCELNIKLDNSKTVPVKIILSRDQNLLNYVKLSGKDYYIRTRSLFENNIKVITNDKASMLVSSEELPNHMNDVFPYVWNQIGQEINLPGSTSRVDFNAKTVLLTLELIDKLVDSKKVIEFNDYYDGEWN